VRFRGSLDKGVHARGVQHDQGAQFTSPRFTEVLEREGVKVSMDGKGRCLDNVWIERLWRSVKYEEVYLNEYTDALFAWRRLADYFAYYNWKRPHQSLDYRTPAQLYFGNDWQLHNPHNFTPLSV
jgi:putative transposase